MCRRCTFNCPMGVDYGMLVRAARSIMQRVGRVPQHLQDTVDTHHNWGSNMAVPQDEFIETIEWIEEELQDEEGCKNFKIPVDKKGAQYFLTLNPRKPQSPIPDDPGHSQGAERRRSRFHYFFKILGSNQLRIV